MATIYIPLNPEAASFKASQYPYFTKVVGTNFSFYILKFDAATDEAAFWRFRATDYSSGNLTLDVYWYADNATSGNVVWEAQISAITPDTDSQDVSTDSLATLNYVQDTHLGTTSKRIHKCTITISNLDSLASGDIVHIRIARDADGTSATDDMANDACFIGAVLSYTST